jgi:hypothetical protein
VTKPVKIESSHLWDTSGVGREPLSSLGSLTLPHVQGQQIREDRDPDLKPGAPSKFRRG